MEGAAPSMLVGYPQTFARPLPAYILGYPNGSLRFLLIQACEHDVRVLFCGEVDGLTQSERVNLCERCADKSE